MMTQPSATLPPQHWGVSKEQAFPPMAVSGMLWPTGSVCAYLEDGGVWRQRHVTGPEVVPEDAESRGVQAVEGRGAAGLGLGQVERSLVVGQQRREPARLQAVEVGVGLARVREAAGLLDQLAQEVGDVPTGAGQLVLRLDGLYGSKAGKAV